MGGTVKRFRPVSALVGLSVIFGLLGLATLGSGLLPSPVAAIPTEGQPNRGLAVVPLTVKSGKTRHQFRVEVARTPQQQATGMMYRDALGPNAGMVFPMTPARPVAFWMANVRIPLDLIFVREDGVIARVAANAPPYSTSQIVVDEPIALVLEIAGGRAAQLGIVAGDTVIWRHP